MSRTSLRSGQSVELQPRVISTWATSPNRSPSTARRNRSMDGPHGRIARPDRDARGQKRDARIDIGDGGGNRLRRRKQRLLAGGFDRGAGDSIEAGQRRARRHGADGQFRGAAFDRPPLGHLIAGRRAVEHDPGENHTDRDETAAPQPALQSGFAGAAERDHAKQGEQRQDGAGDEHRQNDGAAGEIGTRQCVQGTKHVEIARPRSLSAYRLALLICRSGRIEANPQKRPRTGGARPETPDKI